MISGKVVHKQTTALGEYTVVDERYNGRPARVLYSGSRIAAQSGMAKDKRPELLFDYNERFMEIIRGLEPESVLVIGGGSFTLPKALLEEKPHIRLDVVELDAALVEIARQYFDFAPGENTRVFTDDGLAYLRGSQDSYDFIIIDVFMGAELPPAFQTAEAMELAKNRLNPGGVIAMNIISSYYGQRSAALRQQVAALGGLFPHIGIFPAGLAFSHWLPQNFVLTACSQPRDLGQFLRYQGLPEYKS